MGLTDSDLCRCGAEQETSVHVWCECEDLATLRHICLGSFFLGPKNVRSLSLGEIWNCIKVRGLPWLGHQCKGHKGTVKDYIRRNRKGSNPRTVVCIKYGQAGVATGGSEQLSTAIQLLRRTTSKEIYKHVDVERTKYNLSELYKHR